MPLVKTLQMASGHKQAANRGRTILIDRAVLDALGWDLTKPVQMRISKEQKLIIEQDMPRIRGPYKKKEVPDASS